VNLSILKFLGFEQIFKNSLTTCLWVGPREVLTLTKGEVAGRNYAFLPVVYAGTLEVDRPEMDVPAGDIGVGGREIGYLYGMYKKLTHEHNGVLTGKGINWGGSLIRPEATGFGAV
jgi:glutamate dehydrogenase (NADP+)